MHLMMTAAKADRKALREGNARTLRTSAAAAEQDGESDRVPAPLSLEAALLDLGNKAGLNDGHGGAQYATTDGADPDLCIPFCVRAEVGLRTTAALFKATTGMSREATPGEIFSNHAFQKQLAPRLDKSVKKPALPQLTVRVVRERAPFQDRQSKRRQERAREAEKKRAAADAAKQAKAAAKVTAMKNLARINSNPGIIMPPSRSSLEDGSGSSGSGSR